MASGVRQEIWARALWLALDAAKLAGVDLTSAFDGLSFDAKSARNLRRVAWDDYVAFVERIEALVGGPSALARVTEEAMTRSVSEIRTLVGALMSPKNLIRMQWDVCAPLIFPVAEFTYEDCGPNQVHLEATIRQGARDALAVHHWTLGSIRGSPRLLGLPPAVVSGETTARHVRWDVELPPARTLMARVQEASKKEVPERPLSAMSTILGYDDNGDPVNFAWGQEGSAQSRLDNAARCWGLTDRQCEVLELLVRGKANKEIAQELRTAENTIELHVTQLLRRSATTSRATLIARFWSEPI